MYATVEDEASFSPENPSSSGFRFRTNRSGKSLVSWWSSTMTRFRALFRLLSKSTWPQPRSTYTTTSPGRAPTSAATSGYNLSRQTSSAASPALSKQALPERQRSNRQLHHDKRPAHVYHCSRPNDSWPDSAETKALTGHPYH